WPMAAISSAHLTCASRLPLQLSSLCQRRLRLPPSTTLMTAYHWSFLPRWRTCPLISSLHRLRMLPLAPLLPSAFVPVSAPSRLLSPFSGLLPDQAILGETRSPGFGIGFRQGFPRCQTIRSSAPRRHH